jgi:hypothetical protein
MYKNIILNIIISLSLIIFHGCDWYYKEDHTFENREKQQAEGNQSYLKKLWQKGCTFQIEQIYLMPHKETIPILDKPVDTLFKNGRTIVNIGSYTSKYDPYNYVLDAIVLHEKWEFKNITKESDNIVYIEHGFGSNYFLSYVVDKQETEYIISDNPYVNRVMAFEPIWIMGFR